MAFPDAIAGALPTNPEAHVSISVVIPTRNRLPWLVACLESVISQHVPAAEVVVVDDGSTDGTSEAVRSRFPGVRVLRTNGEGPAKARNVGIAAACSEYVAFLDSDDLWYPDTLAHVASVLTSASRPAVLCGRVVTFQDDDTPKLDAESRITYRTSEHLLAALPLPEFPHPSAVVVRRDVLNDAEGFDVPAIPAEDADLYLRIGAAGGCVAVDAPPLAMRRHHSGQLSANLDMAWSGVMRLIGREEAGVYSGGNRYAKARRRLISDCGRFYVPQLLTSRRWSKAFRLAVPTLRWTLRYEAAITPGWLRRCWNASIASQSRDVG
jgi:glycosyltransferase involved in cell wall biosynthesis